MLKIDWGTMWVSSVADTNSGTDVVAPFHPKGAGHQLLTVITVRAQRRSAHFGLDCLNADQGMAKLSRAPHMPNMMTNATNPAAG